MNQLKKIIADAEAQFGEGVQVKMWARAFAGWETDEVPVAKCPYSQILIFFLSIYQVIAVELVRNLCLAMACVFCTTFLLIANFTACLLVLGCVVLTLVNSLYNIYYVSLQKINSKQITG
jgi:hypothetical protein